MATFTETEIGDLVDRVQSWSPATDSDDAEFMYIDLSSVDKDSKSIVSPVRTPRADAPSRARQLVAYRDVLVSTVRPNLNGVAAVPAELNGATASTGFCVLRPRPEMVCWRYLYHWVRSPAFIRDMTRKATGASYPAVSDRIIHESKIPLPKLEEQKRIAAILDKADAIRRKRQESLAASTHLIAGAFRQMFGDCQANGYAFPECEFQELCGKIVDCPHSTPTYAERMTEFACVRSSDIQDGYIDWGSTKYVEKDEYELRIARHTPTAGEVLYTREGGRMGNAARVPQNAKVCLGQRIMLFSEKESETTNEFIWALLNSSGVRHQVKALTAGAAAPRINISDIRKLKAFFPPYELQERFRSVVARIEQLRQRQLAANNDETNLFNSLVQRVFKGEL